MFLRQAKLAFRTGGRGLGEPICTAWLYDAYIDCRDAAVMQRREKYMQNIWQNRKNFFAETAVFRNFPAVQYDDKVGVFTVKISSLCYI